MSGPKLKSCPFCKGKAELIAEEIKLNTYPKPMVSVNVVCEECGASSRGFNSWLYNFPHKEAIDRWNKRVRSKR